MKTSGWLTIILAVIAIGWVICSWAAPPFPHSFYGTVKKDGSNVPNGTVVSAWIGGHQYTSSTTSTYGTDSVYSLNVDADDPDTASIKEGGANGDVISFRVGSDTAGQTATFSSGVDTNLNLTVSSQYTLTVSINPGGGGSVSKNPAKSAYNFGETVQLTATANSGYAFSNWSGDANGSANPTPIIMNGNKNVTANFISQDCTYTLMTSVNPPGTGTITRNPDKAAYCSGEQVMLTAIPNPGYVLSSWGGDASGSTNPLTITMNGNKTVTGNFTSISSGALSVTPLDGLNASGSQEGPFSPSSKVYTLQNPGGSAINWSASSTQSWVTLSSSGGNLASGASTTVTVSINSNANTLGEGYYNDTLMFSNTTNGYGNASRSIVFMVSGAPQQTFAIATNPPGLMVTVDGGGYTAPVSFSWVPGSSHTLSVSSPQAVVTGIRYIYASWSDGGEQSHTIIAPSFSSSYTANFTTQFSLTTSVNPAGAGTVNPSGTSWYNSGESVSVSATANSDYTFDGWSGDLSGSTNPSSVIMNGPKNVAGDFSPNQPPESLSKLVFTISGTDNGGAAVQFGESTFAGHGISLGLGMFEMEGTYSVNPDAGTVDGTYTIYDLDSVVLERGNLTGEVDSLLAAMTLRLSRVDGGPLFNMSGYAFLEEPVIPGDWNGKFSGSTKGTFAPLKIEPYKTGIYSHVFKVSGAGSIPSLGPIDIEAYFFCTNGKGKNAYGIYAITGAISDTGVFSGKMNPASGKFKFSLTNDVGDKHALKGQAIAP